MSTSPKLADCGTQCMMVRYAENHDGDVYRMWNPVTGKFHITHDELWLKQMIFHQRVAEDHANLPPDVECSIIKTPVFVPEEEQDKGPATQLREEEEEVLDAEDDDYTEEPAVFQATEQTHWVTATTRSGHASRVPARYREELNAVAIGLAMKIIIAYCTMKKKKKKKKTVRKQKLNWHVLVLFGMEVFLNTAKLHAMDYKMALKTWDKEKWDLSVEE